MKRLLALVLMQLKDKMDFSFAKDKKQLLIKTVLAVVKFIAITVVCYFAVMLCRMALGLFNSYEIPSAMSFVIALFFVMATLSSTISLVKTMYYSDDNKVLVTFPVSGNVVFVSKLIVFYFYELRKNLALLAPILLGFGLNLVSLGFAHWTFFVVMWFPLVVYTALPVLIGALLSIPALYIYRFFTRFRWVGYAVFVAVLVALIYGTISLISIIPENLDLPNLWPTIVRPFIQNFLSGFESRFMAFTYLLNCFIGERHANYTYWCNWISVLKFLSLIAIAAALFGLVFVTTRNLFYSMMRKSFEFDKDLSEKKIKNTKHGVKTTFLLKEIRLIFRSRESTMTILAVCIIMPILVFLMNKIFSAINTSITGNNMAYAFNLLIITLPILASNSTAASAYSREGRAGYITKTEPVNILIPLTAKIAVNAILCAVSLTVAAAVFDAFNFFGAINLVLLVLSLVLLDFGHLLFSATLDIMNPKNEDYATTGESPNNANENISTLLAFIVSAVYALFSFKLFGETVNESGNITVAFVKLFIIGLLVFVTAGYMYVAKIKAYYYEK